MSSALMSFSLAAYNVNVRKQYIMAIIAQKYCNNHTAIFDIDIGATGACQLADGVRQAAQGARAVSVEGARAVSVEGARASSG